MMQNKEMDMQKYKNNVVRTSASIPREHYVRLENIAIQNKVSMAWVIREAIEKYLKAGSALNSKN